MSTQRRRSENSVTFTTTCVWLYAAEQAALISWPSYLYTIVLVTVLGHMDSLDDTPVCYFFLVRAVTARLHRPRSVL